MKATTLVNAKLTVLRGNVSPSELKLSSEQTYTLGRSRQNSFVLNDEHASRMHAKLFCLQGVWHVEDISLNGTRLDGERIVSQKPTRINNGQSLGIGDCLFRFEIERSELDSQLNDQFNSNEFIRPNPSSKRAELQTNPSPSQPPAAAPPTPPASVLPAAPSPPPAPKPPSNHNIRLPAAEQANPKDPSLLKGSSLHPRLGSSGQVQPSSAQLTPTGSNHFRIDEMSILCQFIQLVAEETNLVSVVRQGLQLLLFHTQANIAGYLSVDPGEPIPKVVLPEKVQMNLTLSRQLTRRVQETGKLVWLGPEFQDITVSGSLSNVQDAVCVPVRGGGQTFAAIHIYRVGSYFSDREVRFTEALVGYLSNQLHSLRLRQNLLAENSRLRHQSPPTDDLVGDSPVMQKLRQRIARAASQPFNTLITGESGVGKELVAYALHQHSPRRDRPFCVVNCATISPAMLEAELFGYVKRAFSGADHDHIGLVLSADDGVLFFDEISELPLDSQAKLERFIETKTFRPVGSSSEIKVDVRIIAATNRDLDAEVQAGRFRPELLYRLRVLQLHVPPLREHPEDIPYLVQYFLDKLTIASRREVKLTQAAIQKLTAYHWPGNVRQLRAVLEGALALYNGDSLDADDIQLPSNKSAQPSSQSSPESVSVVGHHLMQPPSLNLKQLRDWAIDRALQISQDQYAQAAALLGISVTELNQFIQEQGLTPEI